MRSINFVFVIFAVIATCFGDEAPDSELRLVSVMFRHGERTPEPEQMKTFPKYEHKDSLFEPYGVGQLTTEGKETMYELGKKIRYFYAERLYGCNLLDESQVKMESTKYFRSLVSAQLVLGGLLNWDKDNLLNKQWDENDEDLKKPLNADKEKLLKYYYDQKEKCPTYFGMLLASVQAKMQQGKLRVCMPLFQLMVQNLGVTQPDPLKVWEMYEVFKAQQNAGVELPCWIDDEVFGQMKQCIEEFLGIAFETNALKKLSGGIYVDLVMESIKQVVKNKTDVRLELFSGHDTTIAPALAALGGTKGYTKNDQDFLVDIPTYGSAIVLELHKDKNNGRHFVKIQYWNDKNQAEPTELKIKDCSYPCYLKEYRKVVEPVRIYAKKLLDCPKN